jgi:hypothetical protein
MQRQASRAVEMVDFQNSARLLREGLAFARDQGQQGSRRHSYSQTENHLLSSQETDCNFLTAALRSPVERHQIVDCRRVPTQLMPLRLPQPRHSPTRRFRNSLLRQLLRQSAIARHRPFPLRPVIRTQLLAAGRASYAPRMLLNVTE